MYVCVCVFWALLVFPVSSSLELYVCMYVYVCVCVCVCILFSRSPHPLNFMYVCMYVYVCVCVYLVFPVSSSLNSPCLLPSSQALYLTFTRNMDSDGRKSSGYTHVHIDIHVHVHTDMLANTHGNSIRNRLEKTVLMTQQVQVCLVFRENSLVHSVLIGFFDFVAAVLCISLHVLSTRKMRQSYDDEHDSQSWECTKSDGVGFSCVLSRIPCMVGLERAIGFAAICTHPTSPF
jgi:hypothetical protein